MTNVTDLPKQEYASIVGPSLRGNKVVVAGRVIPHLTCHELEDHVELILDGRFSLTVSERDAYPVAGFMANALAIASGYPSAGATSRDRPFAPQIAYLSEDDLKL